MRFGSAAILAAGLGSPVVAERIVVAPGEAGLQAVLDRASEGDSVTLEQGEHRGQIRITRKVTLEGEPGAVLIGNGQGSAIAIAAPDAAGPA